MIKENIKLILSLLLLIMIAVSCNNSKKNIYKYYSNGDVREMDVPKYNNFNDTLVCNYYQNGKLKYKYMTRNGLIQDTESVYNEKGILVEKAMFDSGKYNGIVYGYFNNGILKFIGYAKGQLKIGQWTYFDSLSPGKVNSIDENLIINNKSFVNRFLTFNADAYGKSKMSDGMYFTVLPEITGVINSDTIYSFFISPVCSSLATGDIRVIYGKLGDNFSDFSKADTIYPQNGLLFIPNINSTKIKDMRGVLQFYRKIYIPHKMDSLTKTLDYYFYLNKHIQ